MLVFEVFENPHADVIPFKFSIACVTGQHITRSASSRIIFACGYRRGIVTREVTSFKCVKRLEAIGF